MYYMIRNRDGLFLSLHDTGEALTWKWGARKFARVFPEGEALTFLGHFRAMDPVLIPA